MLVHYPFRRGCCFAGRLLTAIVRACPRWIFPLRPLPGFQRAVTAPQRVCNQRARFAERFGKLLLVVTDLHLRLIRCLFDGFRSSRWRFSNMDSTAFFLFGISFYDYRYFRRPASLTAPPAASPWRFRKTRLVVGLLRQSVVQGRARWWILKGP